MKKSVHLLLFTFLTFFSLFGQKPYEWIPEDNGYLFHMVKKSPILNNNIGQYFIYSGPIIKYIDNTINYDSIENIIILNPEQLLINRIEIAKSPKGLLSEAANKMAIWKLNKLLLARKTKDFKSNRDENDFIRFQKYLIENLPSQLISSQNGVSEYHERIDVVLNPSLAFSDKQMQIASIPSVSPDDELIVYRAITTAINRWVGEESLSIYTALGGEYLEYTNVITAAGDGSLTSGMLEEREKDEKGRYNKGLPKAIGLFPYDVHLVDDKGARGGRKIESNLFSVTDLSTSGNNRLTNLHFDVWGYNSKKQTTVVVEKNGKSYRLFGSGKTRFLTPDSAFVEAGTYKDLIDTLEFRYIARLTEKIYGKKGFDKEIEHHKEERDKARVNLDRESKMGGYSHSDVPIYTKSKGRGGRKKRRSGQAKIDTVSGKSSRKKRQNKIQGYQSEWEFHVRRIKEVEIEKAEAMKLKGEYESLLGNFKIRYGLNPVKFTLENGIYTFADSTTFDFATQEFIFQGSKEKEEFEVRLLAIPNSPLSKQADEVMLHINKVDAEPNYRAKVNLQIEDAFESNSFRFSKTLVDVSKDSLGLKEFFNSLLNSKQQLEIQAEGFGVGYWNGVKTVKEDSVVELIAYPKKAGSLNDNMRNDSIFKRLRKTEVFLNVNGNTSIKVNSYTDQVKSNVSFNSTELKELAIRYQLSQNDVLSVLRSAQILTKLKQELNIAAGKLLTREDAKIALDRLNKEFNNTSIIIGSRSVKLKDLKASEGLN